MLFRSVEKSVRKMVVNVTSLLASIGSKLDVRYSSYSITKTALNMLVRAPLSPAQCGRRVRAFVDLTLRQTYKQVVERPDLTIIALDPGWAKTGMSDCRCTPHASSHMSLVVLQSSEGPKPPLKSRTALRASSTSSAGSSTRTAACSSCTMAPASRGSTLATAPSQ